MATAPSQHRGEKSGIDWRAQLGAKLVAADEAVAHIKSGDRVCLSIAQQTPFELCPALAGRLMELENVVVNHGAAVMNWDLPGLGERFRLESMYLSPYDRAIYHRGAADFTPIVYYRAGHLPPALDNFNVYLMTVSPPDEHGYCNFGEAQIMSKLLARNADLVIAEIDKNSIRVGGDNSIHISEIDYFVERTTELPEIKLPQPGEEEARNIATVCGMVAKELIPDRATVQIGVGSMSGMLCNHLLNHHELGMQTEIIPLHTAPLVEAGVLTGKHKQLFPGLVVGAGIAPLTPREELDFIDGNPAFALYDFNTTDDIRFVAQEEGLISINNAMAVDLTGQTNGESIGPLMYTGTGGQTAFVVAACLAGGKTVIVVPSSSRVQGRRISRIVPVLDSGSVVTSPRGFVHHVVTEYGIANLKGKSIRERINELVAIAHPDFRSELRAEAKRLYKV
ncbi:MAG TPA: acetyl-CoA hydrolase/transferase C-terminal domain-containing protein [Candidatus Binatus sp.]|uniref:acetyl-CoA hydrolase/transferase family protein n=1 Tax=Candidatus Binatus sp. TaxID=2811406 RepID=UPI002B470D45|nr:acetyl-CoA hydrolase/transferase C-terminal domain-containing protein [Candidatus Binatus sp.]HKN14533.1 acetyl-CoA hydrolase/transferase C-terminal domain-containing protein [Candidatus Binatus sp.]